MTAELVQTPQPSQTLVSGKLPSGAKMADTTKSAGLSQVIDRLNHLPASLSAKLLRHFLNEPNPIKANQLSNRLVKGDDRLQKLLDELVGHTRRLDKTENDPKDREKVLSRVDRIAAIFDMRREVKTTTSGLVSSLEKVAEASYAAGFRGKALYRAVAIAAAESSGDNTARNHSCKGYFQIHSKVHRDLLKELHLDLSNPKDNAVAAYFISGAGKNFTPWTTWTQGTYRRYMREAKQAVRAFLSSHELKG